MQFTCYGQITGLAQRKSKNFQLLNQLKIDQLILVTMIDWLFYECNLLDFCTKWKASLSCDICFSRQEVTVQVNFLILRAHYKTTEHIFEPLKNKKIAVT